MARPVTVSIDIPAPAPIVWSELADLGQHAEWMADAHAIAFLTEARSGIGARMEVETRFGPFRTADVMEVTAWDHQERIAVAHRGLFTGAGAFTMAPSPTGTLVTWTERIHFPWFFGGPAGAWLARPIFRWVWRRNLQALSDRISGR